MESNSSSGGIGFVGLLTIALIVLKLCGVIAWGWWWVLTPIWLSVAVLIAVGAFALFFLWLAGKNA